MNYEIIYIFKKILLSIVTFFVVYYYNLSYEEKIIKCKLPIIKNSFIWTRDFREKYIFKWNKRLIISFSFMFIVLAYLESLLTTTDNQIFLFYQILLISIQGIYTYHNYNKLKNQTQEKLIYKIFNNIFKQYKNEWNEIPPSDDNILVLNIIKDIKNNKEFLTEEIIYLLLEIRKCEESQYGNIFLVRREKLIEKLKFQYYSSFEK